MEGSEREERKRSKSASEGGEAGGFHRRKRGEGLAGDVSREKGGQQGLRMAGAQSCPAAAGRPEGQR